MVTFQIPGMTCGHCAGAVSRAVAAVDRDAQLEIRIRQKLVRIRSTASAAALAQAIQDAGYTPQPARDAPAAPDPGKAGGCGCGPARTAPVDARQVAAAAGSSCCG